MPRYSIRRILLSTIVLASFAPAANGQDCSPPPITANSRNYNIFSPEQEMVLGDLTYQRLSGESRFLRDEELTAYLNRLGQKLARHLPPTGLEYRFHIIDIPQANAFNIPGGHVFVSRKLIGFSNNEDELAGVMAHELGHAVVRHGASDLSELFKKVLNVTQLGDRKDVAEKYNLFIEKQRTKDISRRGGHENEQQLEADRIGVFAMVAAGYDPYAFSSFFGRLTETKGKTGSWFSDVFGKPNPEEKRMREMAKATESLPAQCRENRQANASQEFLKWQANVVSASGLSGKEELPALLWKKELSPKLRSDISHFAFSPDGKHFLAQDDFAITVVRREPLQVAFQIRAPEAKQASFTPDGEFVVFGTESLRYEKWSVADKKPVQVRELVLRRDCWEQGLSPDGKYLACVDYATNLSVLETQTGKKVWEKKEFYGLSFWEFLTWITAQSGDNGEAADQNRFFHIEYSPDSRFLMVSRTNKFRFRFLWSGAVEESENTLAGVDLTTLKTLSTGGELKKVTRRPFLFLDSNRILGMASQNVGDSGIFSFPEGKRLARFPLGGEELKTSANPNYVIVKPVMNAKLGVFDLSRNQLVVGMNKTDVTFWNNLIVSEGASGKVMLSEVTYNEESKILQRKEVGSIDLPVSYVGQLNAAEVSDDFHWLAISSKTRGALWHLSSGERKMFVRGFRGALLANDGRGIGDFPRMDPDKHSLVLLDPLNNATQIFREIPEKGAKQYGRFLLLRKSLKEAEKKEDKKPDDKKAANQAQDISSDVSLAREVRLELRDVLTDKVVWSHDYPKEAPRLFFDDFSGRLIFYWTLGSDIGKARLKEDPALAARSIAMGNKNDDYLAEVLDAFAGKTIGTLLLETGKGSFDIKAGFSEGDWLILRDSQNRVLAYSLKDAALRHRFFGTQAAINPSRQQIAVENYPGEMTIYDLISGEPQAKLLFKSGSVFARFSLDGKRLFVLTAEQAAHAFDMEKLTTTASR
jgi:hypothetical protein